MIMIFRVKFMGLLEAENGNTLVHYLPIIRVCVCVRVQVRLRTCVCVYVREYARVCVCVVVVLCASLKLTRLT